MRALKVSATALMLVNTYRLAKRLCYGQLFRSVTFSGPERLISGVDDVDSFLHICDRDDG